MLSTPLRALLGVLGAIVVVGIVGYVSGAFDRFAAPPPAQIAAVPPATAPDAKPGEPAAKPASANPSAGAPAAAPSDAKPADAAPAQTAPTQAAPPQPASAEPAKPEPANPEPAKAEIVPPTFDILRAEADGSIVIAGLAPAGSKVEILAGSKVIGAAVAGSGGDFAVVIDDPLTPGSYQIVLRATDETNTVAMSTETAVVSIPEKPDGQVLALVEQPGQPSKLITVPEPMTSTPAAPAAGEAQKPADTAPAAAAPQAPATTAPAATPAQPEAKPAEVAVAKPDVAPEPPAKGLVVEVKAIEIEGNKVFVAGVATPKKSVRAYANAIMLGETKSSETGEFLIEALVDLPVGDYIVRADLLADDGNKVLMRAQVPFRREAGEAISAVAPASPPATAPSASAAAPSAPAPSATTQAPAATQPAGATTETKLATAEAPVDAVEAAVPKPDLALPTEPPSVTAAPLQSVDGAVIIRRGDSLWRISRRVYGRGVRYSTIYLANQKQIADPDRIWPGQVFSVPVKTDQGETADMEAVADQKASPADVGKAGEAR